LGDTNKNNNLPGDDTNILKNTFPENNNEDSFFDDFESKYSFFADAAAEQEAVTMFDDDFLETKSGDSIDLMSSSKSDKADEGSKKSKRKKKPKKKRSTWGKILHVFLSVMLVGVISLSIIIGAFWVYVNLFIDPNNNPDDPIHQVDLNNLKLEFTTMVYIYDEETGDYIEYQPLHGEFNRKWVLYNETMARAEAPEYEGIPQDLADAFVAIEDETFWTHGGVNWKRTVGAFANMFLDFWSSNQGGSTITQQLVKNVLNDRDQNAMRKVREIMRARYIESNYSKDTIVECYLNTISMAGGMYGVEVAANYYFGKSVDELSIAECASLAAIAKEPERYRPDKNPQYNKERRALVLGKMLECGFITKEEHDAALKEEIVVVANKDNVFNEEDNSYFVDALIEEVIQGLANKYNIDKSEASNNFYNGGYKIYATVDPEIQAILEEEYADMDHFPESKKTGKRPQSAMTVMNYQGHIVATVGGTGEKTGLREYNRATMSKQQPGSSIKPLSVYAPALEYNIITYSSLYNDAPINLNGWRPKNAYSGYYGLMPTAKAIELSCNTIAVRTLLDLSVESSYSFLTNRMGITTFQNDVNKDLNCSSLALGGSYEGITVTESTAAYAAFGNLGKYYKPTTFTKVTDQHDNVILSYDPVPSLAMSEDTATIMNYMMQRVIYGGSGTAKQVADFNSKIKAFGKTGTTSNQYDRWFVGGTPYYVAGCWFGFDENERISNTKEVLVIWENVMRKIHKDLPEKDFPTSQFVTRRRYCKESGALATASCPEVAVGYYKISYLPTCPIHRGLSTDEVQDSELDKNGNLKEPVKPEPGDPSTPTTPSTPSTPSNPMDDPNIDHDPGDEFD